MLNKYIVSPADDVPLDAEWRIVPHNKNYEVSEYGHVRRLAPGSGAIPGKLLKPYKTGGRYFKYDLQLNKYNNKQKAHRLVALTFIGNPNLSPCVLHNDGNVDNCHYSNLRWGNQVDNYQDSLRHGTRNHKRI